MNHDTQSEQKGRQVYLPATEVETCAACHRKASHHVGTKLRTCTGCGEVAYCSETCQSDDWKSHKIQCKQTDRVDFESFYPFLAYIATVFRESINYGTHPAFHHVIINSMDLNSQEHPVVTLPNGFVAKPVFLGPETDLSGGMGNWWPNAPSERTMKKLFRRIANEGMLLPMLLSLCIALVSEMYTTTVVPPAEKPVFQFTGRRKLRLSYGKPVVDFGIVQGSVHVTSVDRLAYYFVHGDKYFMGQNPDDHYGIYIKILGDAEWFLDLGMYTFNLASMVKAVPYSKDDLPKHDFVPAYFIGKDAVKESGVHRLMFQPRRYHSVLRDPRVHQIVEMPDLDYCKTHDIPDLLSMMEEISGRKCEKNERNYLADFLPFAVAAVRTNVINRDWTKFPEKPTIGFDTDADEEGVMNPSPEKEAYVSFMNSWGKKVKKGKDTREHFHQELHKLLHMPDKDRLKKLGVKN